LTKKTFVLAKFVNFEPVTVSEDLTMGEDEVFDIELTTGAMLAS
jgi:hypothetical protein